MASGSALRKTTGVDTYVPVAWQTGVSEDTMYTSLDSYGHYMFLKGLFGPK